MVLQPPARLPTLHCRQEGHELEVGGGSAFSGGGGGSVLSVCRLALEFMKAGLGSTAWVSQGCCLSCRSDYQSAVRRLIEQGLLRASSPLKGGGQGPFLSPPAVALCSRLLLRGYHLLSVAPPYFPPGLMVCFSGILSPSNPVSVSCLCHNTYGASQVVLVVKNWPANAGDVSLIPGLERSPGGGHGNPLQYSCLENSMNLAHKVAKS